MRHVIYHTPRVFLFGLLFVIFSAIFLIHTARSVSLLCNVSGWEIDAMPAALSHILYNHPRDYTEFSDVGERFRHTLKGSDCKSVDTAIDAIKQHNPLASTQSKTLGSDDKGVVDFVTLSFISFGMETKSLPQLYFSILFCSIGLLIFSFRKDIFITSIMGLFLFCFALIVPFIAYYGQLTSFLALRAFPSLGLVATLHLVLASFIPQRGKGRLLALIMQAAIIALVVHVRFAGIYQLITVVSAGVFAIFWALQRHEAWSSIRARAIPMLLSMLMVFATCMDQRNRMAEQYTLEQQGAHHVFWHSLFSGLAFSEIIQKEWSIKLDDVSVIAATGRYLASTGRDAELAVIGGYTPNSTIHWEPYDQAVKRMFFAVCRVDITACLTPLIFIKPGVAFELIAWISGITEHIPHAELLDSTVQQQLVDAQKITYQNAGDQAHRLGISGFDYHGSDAMCFWHSATPCACAAGVGICYHG